MLWRSAWAQQCLVQDCCELMVGTGGHACSAPAAAGCAVRRGTGRASVHRTLTVSCEC